MQTTETKRFRFTKAAIEAARTELEKVQKGCRSRLLTDGDIDWAIDAYKYARKVARRIGVDPDTALASIDGGAVNNSYFGRADSTKIGVSKDGIEVVRGNAGSCSYGRGTATDVSVACPEGKRAKEVKAPFGLTFRKYAGRLHWD